MGPKALLISLNTAPNVPQSFDLVREFESGQIDNIQAVFIDNGPNTGVVTLSFSDVPFKLITKPFTQGVFPVFGKCLGPITLVNNSAGIVNLIFLNTPMPLSVWACS